MAVTAIATILVVGIAAAQETPTAPAPVVRTPQQRGVVSDATRAMTTEQAPLVRTPVLSGTELESSLPALGTAQTGSVPLFVDPNGTAATSPSLTTGTSPSTTTGTSPQQFTTGPQQFTTGSQAFTTGSSAGTPTVIVIVPSPTTASPASADTGRTFVDSTTTVSPLFEASQQARRDQR